ncbi:tetratricopeptide repeat domain-containing protein [Cordyceps javanica]|uniref:Tetratricopeptide repeat domain-containing protein n=1 Tax=Cordyceps javanica TaxID=43265 RepID=A0A545UPK3_9HYPO|nr:tetratricopeptide repeat domain-containing protein [Cordyceps javanica]TQW03189.1 tetratricopeptide repeat domain-containing protein [Cordyceps javanica]
MDPLSIIAGTVGIADVSVRIIAFLVDIKEASEKIQDEITILSQEVSSLLAVNESVEDFFHSRHDLGNFEEPFDDDSPAEKLWKNLALLLQQSKVAIEQLETLLREVVGKKGNQVAGKIDGLRKTIRRKGRDGDYMQLRQRLVNFQSGFQMLLNALNLYYTLKSHPPKDLAVGNLSENLRRQNVKLQSRIGKLRRELKESSDSAELYDSLVSADAVASLIRFNEHFYTPQNVSSYYTGRQKQLDELASILNVTSSRQRQTHQKRFIITGLGGSGKTQFCCKFAQDNRENFWGIFWIDGSSSENAQHSFAKIAKIGGREPNENAAKSWLSSLQHPWLLLIDNADDPEADLMRYFPSGERGVILITTRNPTNIRYGTEDKLCFHFEKLEEEEASDLLLAAAAFPRPWGVPTKQQAVKIAQVLGYLPLALIHAGKAILEKLCSLGDYTEYYERSWNKIRLNRSRSPSRGREVENTSSMRVYSSYEMIYVGLESKQDQRSRDALQLLKVFSFFHRENIELDLLKTAAMNPRREREDAHGKEQDEMQAQSHTRPQDWRSRINDWLVSIAGQLASPSNVLPEVLRDEDDIPFDEDRLRLALSLLVRLGMVTLQDENNSYWMHPLVHTWVRQRPGTSTAEQAIWCRAAATVLVQSVLFRAPRAYAARNERMQRQIRLHVEHVLKLQDVISGRITKNQSALRRPWPLSWLIPQPKFRTFEAVEYAKFSLVYLQCGEYEKAEELQLQVKEYIFRNLGPVSKHGIDIALLLSHNYVLQTRNNEARTLQHQVLESAQKYYGMDHPKTLQVMDTLGATCLMCSRFNEAKKLHETVIEKLSELDSVGPEHESTWTAVDNLSRVKLRYFDNMEAIRLQRQAYMGFERILGPTHQKTLEAKDNLASIYGFMGEDQLLVAHQMSDEVLQIRIKELGHEHPFTLKTMLTLAKIKTALNQFDDAEAIFLEGLPTAERNLGKSHLGTITGRIWLAHLYWRQGRYAEAGAIWEDVIEKRNFQQSKREDGEHGDRAQAMWFLVHCYEDQGRLDEALELCEQLQKLLRGFGGDTLAQQHKLWKYVEEKTQQLKQLKTQPPDQALHPPNASSYHVPPKRVIADCTY